jgi:hypothetical protein
MSEAGAESGLDRAIPLYSTQWKKDLDYGRFKKKCKTEGTINLIDWMRNGCYLYSMKLTNLSFFFVLSGLFFAGISARAQTNSCGFSDPDERVGNGFAENTEIKRGYTMSGCTKIVEAHMNVVQGGQTVFSVSSPMQLDVSNHTLSVPAKNDCTTVFEPSLRAFALAKLSHMTEENLTSNDIPLCSEVKLPTGTSFVVYRGFLPDAASPYLGSTSALMSAIQFNPATGEIIEWSDSASGM